MAALDWPDLVERVLDTSRAEPATDNLPDLDPGRGYYATFRDMTWFWLERCRTTRAPIVEKMVLFWHGHLCTSMEKVFDRRWMFDQHQLFRTAGLGSFEELVQRTSVQPAMLRYLDNDRNAAGNPNENFARELMELFTIGVGNYTEDDVVAAARAWTGHTIDDRDRYVFRPEAHDWEPKTFFGDTRNWDGPMIIDHLLGGPTRQAAGRHIGRKLWSFLAYPNPEPEVVDAVGGAFIAADFDIKALLRAILLHPRFRSDQARNGLVRSPIEYAVHAMRVTGLPSDVAHPEWTLRQMGQQPFHPPNVSGWRQNGYWINTSATWAKTRFANHLRWRLYEHDELGDSSTKTPEAAADAALARFAIADPSTSTRQTLVDYVRAERGHTSWAERAGLLFLPLVSPEMQLA